jgi:hypothetical protein
MAANHVRDLTVQFAEPIPETVMIFFGENE